MKVYLILAGFLSIAAGLYEDQIGKFEWRQRYVGKPKFSNIDINSAVKKVVVGTEENVVAALSLKTSEILWRQILENGKEGQIQMMHVDNGVVTVSGTRSPVVRGWDLELGHALFEWSIGPVGNKDKNKWMVLDNALVLIQFSHSEVVAQWFNVKTGSAITSKSVETDALDPIHCIVQGTNIVCLDQDNLLTIFTIKKNDLLVKSKINVDQVKNLGSAKLAAVEGKLPIFSVATSEKQFILTITPDVGVVPIDLSTDSIASSTATDDQDLVVVSELNAKSLKVRTYSLDGAEMPSLRSTVTLEQDAGKLDKVTAVCQKRQDFSVACRLLLSTSDDAVTLLQHPGSVLWARQEALASIVSAEIVELPVSETDAAIGKEFSNKEYGFLGMVGRRVCSQWAQLQSLLLLVLGVQSEGSLGSDGLVRDNFGLHKLIVAVTRSGKVFGIDNLSGEIVWQTIADMRPMGTPDSPHYALFLMRSPIHMPHPAQLAVLGRTTTGSAALLVLNPITGVLAEPLRVLPYRVQQATALHQPTDDFIRGILLLDDAGIVHIYPESAKPVAKSLASSTFLYTINPTNGEVNGFGLRVASDGELVTVQRWQQKLGQDEARVVAVAGKRDNERVHSQGRVLGDRSVLYKYANPNLVAIFTQGYHPTHKTILNVYLIDAVSGLVVFSASHRRARDPVHAVHSENWLVYSYINEKHRRTEIATIELYEGATQSNETAFSSLASPPLLPIVERQAYILPAHVITLKDTVTEKGITTKDIMVALSSGGVLELPWMYLDPRRTMMVTQEMREEGVIPYMPELPIPMEAIVNHNQSVAQIRGIHTAPSGIESTCLVFVYGLDILYTRVAPSKTFDLLKEDFDYYLISAVLAALIIASFVTRRMASRKALRQAWK